MFRRIAVTAAVGLLLSSQVAVAASPAFVARVGAVSGSVMISQNGRLAPASAGSVLRPGDRVMAANGKASVVYGDGCNVAITARSMVTVSAASPCAGGSSNVVQVSTRAEDDDRGGTRGYGYWDDNDVWIWLGFGVLTIGATAAAFNDDDHPVSP